MSSIASLSSLMAAAMLLTPTGPPLNLSMMVRKQLAIDFVEAVVVDLEQLQRARATSAVIRPSARTCA